MTFLTTVMYLLTSRINWIAWFTYILVILLNATILCTYQEDDYLYGHKSFAFIIPTILLSFCLIIFPFKIRSPAVKWVVFGVGLGHTCLAFLMLVCFIFIRGLSKNFIG